MKIGAQDCFESFLLKLRLHLGAALGVARDDHWQGMGRCLADGMRDPCFLARMSAGGEHHLAGPDLAAQTASEIAGETVVSGGRLMFDPT